MTGNRVELRNNAPVRASARYVLYWAQVNRRVDSNHALAFAANLANHYGLPLLMYEGLTCSHPFANDRFHTFVLQGVPETARRAASLGIGYVFYWRRKQSDPNDAVYRLAKDAAALVTDEFPAYLPRGFNATLPAKIDIPYFTVDASCIVPMACFDQQQYAAYTIRPRIQRILDQHLQPVPRVRLRKRFTDAPSPLHTAVDDAEISKLVASCEIDHSVKPSPEFHGGRLAAKQRLNRFLKGSLRRYARHSREPAAHATSQLSPYLHFGCISALEVALAVREYALRHRLIATEFLEQLIVRRELAFNFARLGPPAELLSALPDWAQTTLAKHDPDPREFLYSRLQFEQAATHDALWNAAQRELLRTGLIHGYTRMYWGKKIIEWSATHQEALATMLYLNDRYALDGRDPNTYTNILWCFGLHDRPWKERPIFGMIRYMSLDGMKRKTDVEAYVRGM
jgi:deoxyribodipyrimidine photo-lyase